MSHRCWISDFLWRHTDTALIFCRFVWMESHITIFTSDNLWYTQKHWSQRFHLNISKHSFILCFLTVCVLQVKSLFFLCRPSCLWDGLFKGSIHLLQFVSSPSGTNIQCQRGVRAEVEYWLDQSEIFASLERLTPHAPTRLSEWAAQWIHSTT